MSRIASINSHHNDDVDDKAKMLSQMYVISPSEVQMVETTRQEVRIKKDDLVSMVVSNGSPATRLL